MRITAGDHEGRIGFVKNSAWLMDDSHETVVDGPPPGYEVMIREDPESAPGNKREIVPTEALRRTTREETLEVLGLQTRFESVWDACERWAQTLLWWHQDTHPEVWPTENPDGRAPVVTALMTAALFDTVRQRGLDEPDDGSSVHLAPLLPMADTLGRPYRGSQ
ncbi:hypothetical protein OG528_29295 [Streptomyces platensis]|uniref:hypothetical protein n=1 Tax=Streptomyces platensis TaxID=58346 RepID=UPI0030E4C741